MRIVIAVIAAYILVGIGLGREFQVTKVTEQPMCPHGWNYAVSTDTCNRDFSIPESQWREFNW